MGWINDFKNASEKVITSAIVSKHVTSFINEVGIQVDDNNHAMTSVIPKINDTIDRMGTIIKRLSELVIDGSKTGATHLVKGLEDTEPEITSFVTANAPAIKKLIEAFNMLNTEANKAELISIGKSIITPAKDYFENQFTETADKLDDDILTPLSDEIDEIWGIHHKYYILEEVYPNKSIQVDEDTYATHKANHKGNFYETKTRRYTKEITKAEFDKVKENAQ